MKFTKTVYSVGSLAVLAGRTPRAVQLRLKKEHIAPDLKLRLPGGRSVALFDEETMATLLSQKTQDKL